MYPPIIRYPDYSIHGQSPAFRRSDSHDRGMKKRSWKVFRPCTDCFLIFFYLVPLFPSNSLGGKLNFQILSLSLSSFVSHENSWIALDEDWFRTSWKLFFLFNFRTSFKTVSFLFWSLRNLRKDSIWDFFDRFIRILINLQPLREQYLDIQEIYWKVSYGIVKDWIGKWSDTVIIHVVSKHIGYYREDLWIPLISRPISRRIKSTWSKFKLAATERVTNTPPLSTVSFQPLQH